MKEPAMDDEITIVRVYIKEADHGRRKTLMEELLNILHDQQRISGVVVFRGIAGFGSRGEVHAADILRLTVDLPIVIEFFDRTPIAEAAIRLIKDQVPADHIVRWTGRCGVPVENK
jgi:PII-like signaling protein